MEFLSIWNHEISSNEIDESDNFQFLSPKMIN